MIIAIVYDYPMMCIALSNKLKIKRIVSSPESTICMKANLHVDVHVHVHIHVHVLVHVHVYCMHEIISKIIVFNIGVFQIRWW